MQAGGRVYHALLFCYPREFRDEYGEEMELLFRERSREERQLLLWFHLLADIAITSAKERGFALMTDLSYAIHVFRKNPAFTVMAVLALTLGIGVNSAMFSIIDSVLLHNLPFKESGSLAMLWQPLPDLTVGTPYIAASAADFRDWEKQNRSFAYLAGFAFHQASLSLSAVPESVAETLVTGDFFSVFGVPPLLGAPIVKAEETSGASRIAVLSYRLWKNRFNSDRTLIGKDIRLEGENYRVIGVMPPHFRFPEGNQMPALYGFPPATDLWVPIGYSEAKWHDRNNHALLVIGRLKRGATASQAQADLTNIRQKLLRIYPRDERDFGVLVTPLIDIAVGSLGTKLLLLFAAVGFVLLIACANVANLLLARATVRRREIALRMALGAPRSRLYKQLLTESVLLALLGGTGGIVLATALLHLVLAFAPATVPRLAETRLNWQVVAFASAVSFLTGILFGIVPAFQLVRGGFMEALQKGSRGQVGGGGSNLRNALVVCEVALATVLLIGAGLTLRSLLRVEGVNPGFRTGKVVTMDLALPAAKYQDFAKRQEFFQSALERVAALPGIESAGLVSALPLSNQENLGALEVKGKTVPGEGVTAERRWASQGYFPTLGIPLIAGRYFEPFDVNPGFRSAVVSEAVARRFFPGENPLGAQIRIGKDWRTIVGVIGDVHNASLESTPRFQVYLYYTSRTPQAMSLVVRSPEESGRIAASVRRAIAAVDPDQSVADVRTMDQLLNGSLSARRFATTVVTIFGALALLLTIVGLYGVVAYNVAQRARELAVRIALGAMWNDVVGMVLREALGMAAAGVIAGGALALLGSRFAASFVYGVPARDWTTFFTTAALLVSVAAIAAYFPARRAASTDPNIVLRHE